MSNTKKNINGFSMTLNPSDHGISSTLIRCGCREKAFMHLIKRSICEGDVCFDLGANIGYTALHMLRQCGPSGFLYAVEPDPRNIKLLKTNLANNSFTAYSEISQCVISDTDGEIEFWMSTRPNTSSVQKNDKSTKKISVTSYKLGTFLQDRQHPAFIKMDIEGHEVAVLEAAVPYFLESKVPVKILMEIHPSFYDEENDMAAVLKAYFDIGFQTKHLVSTPIARPKAFKDLGYEPEKEFHTDGFVRAIYSDVSNKDAIPLICDEYHEPFFKDGQNKVAKKVVRSMLIERSTDD